MDVVLLVVQSLLIVLAATLFGFRASPGEVLLGLGLVALLGIAIGSASYAIALKVKLEYVFASVLSSTIVPLMLLSGVLLPMSNGPKWLYWLSRVNPLAHVVDAERSIFNTGSVLLGLISASAPSTASQLEARGARHEGDIHGPEVHECHPHGTWVRRT